MPADAEAILVKQLIVGRLMLTPNHEEELYEFRGTGTVLPVIAGTIERRASPRARTGTPNHRSCAPPFGQRHSSTNLCNSVLDRSCCEAHRPRVICLPRTRALHQERQCDLNRNSRNNVVMPRELQSAARSGYAVSAGLPSRSSRVGFHQPASALRAPAGQPPHGS
jgi:hypothetical protein